jgi:hypothetical protein
MNGEAEEFDLSSMAKLVELSTEPISIYAWLGRELLTGSL